jgi:periplasmic protein CpxP/Spy
MNPKRRVMAGVLVAMLVLTAAPALSAAPGQRGGPPRMGEDGMGPMAGLLGRMGRLRQELGLSEAQVSQLRAIAQEARNENAADRQLVRDAQRQAMQILLADPNATAQAQAILEAQADARSRLHANMLQNFSRMLNVLTPEQRAKLQEHLARRAGRF